MGLFFQPSVPLYHEFVQGRTVPYSAYLVAGPNADGYCFGLFGVTVLVPFKAAMFDVTDPDKLFWCPYSFDCLSFYSELEPKVQIAYAETRFVRANEFFTLKDLDPNKATCYEQDLNRLLSI